MIGQIQYGIVRLELTKVNSVSREVILSDDGVDYLYTQTTVDVIATYNPAATSYRSVQGNFPVTAPGEFAGRTDRVISDYLAQPRRKLLMWTYDKDLSKRVYLESPPGSPPNNLAGDAKNGPVCKVFSVQEVHGARTWIMHLQFTTWVNNCYDSTSPILSHRWERNIDSDEQHRAIATTTGTVVFHAGRLFSENQSPDFYREQFFQAPPINFAREHINVNVSSDNTMCRYTVVDVERFFNIGGPNDPFGVSPAVKVEASLTTWCSIGSMINVAAAAAPSVGSAIGGLLPQRYEIPGSVFWWGRQASSAWNIATNAATSAVDQLPKYYANVKVRAHGARDSSRKSLADLAMAIAFSRLGSPTFWTMANRSEMVMNQDLADTFVEFDLTLRWMSQTWFALLGALGPVPAATSMIPLLLQDKVSQRFFNEYLPRGGTPNNPNGNNTYMTQNAENGVGQPNEYQAGRPLLDQNVRNLAASLKRNRPVNAASPADENSRGVGYMRKVMVQALKGDPCDIPPIPGWNTVAHQQDIWDVPYQQLVSVRRRNYPMLVSDD